MELFAVLAMLALFAAVALPALAKPREMGWRVICVNNLRQIAHGWLMWAEDHGGSGPPIVNAADGGTKSNQNTYAHFLVASNEIGSPALLVCPSDTRQHPAETWAQFDSPPFRNNAVSYFAGMHLGFFFGAAPLLSGDPNLNRRGSSLCGVAQVRVTALFARDSSLAWDSTRLHQDFGNVAFGDGSVFELTTAGLREKLAGPVAGDENAEEHILFPP